MKTTIDLPEELLHRAKVAAAERRTTLKKLVLQGLAQVIEHPVADAEARRRATIQKLLDRMEATNTKPMVPLRRDEIYDR
jgi:hypothetical protein